MKKFRCGSARTTAKIVRKPSPSRHQQKDHGDVVGNNKHWKLLGRAASPLAKRMQEEELEEKIEKDSPKGAGGYNRRQNRLKRQGTKAYDRQAAPFATHEGY
tara:strand:+ start:302 stop:607 length:306 start_codon:yes stop_codon:yes gene_type:complete